MPRAYLSGVVRRDGVTLAISTRGDAPGLAGLLREALDAVLPRDLRLWMDEARLQRLRWRRDGVAMAARRPLLLHALNVLYARRARSQTPADRPVAVRHGQRAAGARCRAFRPVRRGGVVAVVGRVSLVGAGPGDPGLLTRRAAARLRAADLVLFDALVDDRVLKLARRAQRFYVGKRAGRHALSQLEIHAMMIRAARRGRRVVRLKGGDPFVFGRGGEEALALRDAGVPFEIVPGVTSMIAAPALAGIPLTHRGVAASVFITSGHDEDAFRAAVDGLTPAGLTLVIAMGYARRAVLAGQLVAAGWAADTPAAVVAAASLPDQQVWRGTIGEMASGASSVEGDHAALLIVGEVAALALSDRPDVIASTGIAPDDRESDEIQPARLRER